MADKDDEVQEEQEDGAVAEPKGKGLGALVPGLLKWVAIALGAIILIVTVVIITMNFAGSNKGGNVTPITEPYAQPKEILSWYQSVGTVRTRSSDALPANIVVEVALGYKTDDKTAPSELTSRLVELKDFMRRYFTRLKAEDLKPDNEAKLRIEIRNAINDEILSGSKIRDVKFLTLDVIEQ